jgi:hypothetical protein
VLPAGKPQNEAGRYPRSVCQRAPADSRPACQDPRAGSLCHAIGVKRKMPGFGAEPQFPHRMAVERSPRALAPVVRNAWRRHYKRSFCAKRSQFGAARNTGQVLWGQGVTTNENRRSRWKNKANSETFKSEAPSVKRGSALVRTSHFTLGRGPLAPNEPNFSRPISPNRLHAWTDCEPEGVSQPTCLGYAHPTRRAVP